MSPDFVEMLSALRDAGAEYLVVGAHALAAHGRPRATGDLDVWVRPTPENARRVWSALETFGAPLTEVSVQDFSSADIVFQIGVAPNRIDIMTSVSGLGFDEAWEGRITAKVSGVVVPIIGREALMRNKRAAGRPRDLADLADLERDP